MANEECRKLFIDKGLTYKDINKEKIEKLKELLEIELFEFGKTNTEIRMELTKAERQRNIKEFNEDGSLHEYFFRIKGTYFSVREAISFNPDGFIGFAGWADSTNVQPMLSAFNKWVSEIC